jgi:DNA-binding CsgD family transcriptional regulator
MDFDSDDPVAIVASPAARARLRALLEEAGWHVVAEADSIEELEVRPQALVVAADQGGAEDHGGGITESLTSRELDVLEALAEGLSNRSIAARLGISEHTVKFHLASIYGKLGASTRAQAIRRGFRRGLITL